MLVIISSSLQTAPPIFHGRGNIPEAENDRTVAILNNLTSSPRSIAKEAVTSIHSEKYPGYTIGIAVPDDRRP
jgi:hypothetical protein